MINNLLKENNIDAYLTKTGDEHLSEYIGESDQRVCFLTGFTGSNGLAVTCHKNVLYTDSRYYLQVEKESKDYKLMKTIDTPLEEYLSSCLITRVGLCTKLFSKKFYDTLKNKLEAKGIEIVPFEDDLVDKIWENKPKKIFNDIYSIENELLSDYHKQNLKEELIDTNLVHLKFIDKLEKVREFIKENEILIITELDTISWLFNLRGNDIPYNPVFYSYATVTKSNCKLFINGKLRCEINEEHVKILRYDQFNSYINNFIADLKDNLSVNVNVDLNVIFSGSSNAFISLKFPNSRTIDDIRKLQSIKGKEEIEGFKLAYILDGIALTRLFEFIEINYKTMTEKDVADKLHEFKKDFYGYKSPSFATIAGVGSNSAIVHYEAGDKPLEENMPLLIDSGSNYIFGTTDTTRTLFIGESYTELKSSTNEFKRNYTRVLKGQLRAMTKIYPHGISGNIVDALTRLDLWKKKLDYGHASGHGVGYFLCVHESPPTLSPNCFEKISPSQIFSIEPGYYKDGEYGIRIENLVLSEDIGDGFMKIRNITYVPYQLNLIDVNLLTDEEITFLNKISRDIRKNIGGFIKGGLGYNYLIRNTEEITKD